jgi:thiamine-monophosphate kinase
VKTLRDIGEDALIDRLIDLVPKDPNPAAGPGDDCAVIDRDPASPTLLLLKTDAIVEHVHFLPSAEPRAVGWKAAARVVSDFAAMGGRPEHFLITLALAPETPLAWAEDLYRGIGDCLATFGAVLAGGETTRVPTGSAAVISISATGAVQRDHVVLRSTARCGDAIFVTGNLGGSLQGKHLDFIPRIEQTQWLVSTFKPTAMMDISDGLAKDLPRLATASGCGSIIDPGALPLSPGCTPQQGISDGEDFEILFTIEPARAADLLAEWTARFPDLAITCIGEITDAENGMTLTGGWDHFRSTPAEA